MTHPCRCNLSSGRVFPPPVFESGIPTKHNPFQRHHPYQRDGETGVERLSSAVCCMPHAIKHSVVLPSVRSSHSVLHNIPTTPSKYKNGVKYIVGFWLGKVNTIEYIIITGRRQHDDDDYDSNDRRIKAGRHSHRGKASAHQLQFQMCLLHVCLKGTCGLRVLLPVQWVNCGHCD